MVTKTLNENYVQFINDWFLYFQLYLTFHSYGQYILYPWGFAAVDADDVGDLHAMGQAAAEAMRRASGRAYSVGSAAKLLYPAAGKFYKSSVQIIISYNLLYTKLAIAIYVTSFNSMPNCRISEIAFSFKSIQSS